MMLINSDRLRYLLHAHKDKFFADYEQYLEKLSKGYPRVKEKYATKDRVLATVISKFLKDNESALLLPVSEDRISITRQLLPLVKDMVKEYWKEKEGTVSPSP